MEVSPQEGLAARLRSAGSSALLELVRDHFKELTPREVRQILLNSYVTPEVIAELAEARHLLAEYPVRRALAQHRRTPEAVALRFVGGLFWNDLLGMTLDVRIRPAVRRVAEKYLLQRLPRLSLGEKIGLARRASRAVLVELRRDPHPRVIGALLDNPRLTETVLVPLAASSHLPRILDVVARDRRWGERYDVRVALSRNSATPFRAIFAILPTLRLEDLQAVASQEEHSTMVRHRAEDLLAERAAAGGAFDHPIRPPVDSSAQE